MPKQKVLVAWIDNCDIPRAWARGPANKVEDVRAVARDYLERYKAGKPDQSCVAELEPFEERISYYSEEEYQQRVDDV